MQDIQDLEQAYQVARDVEIFLMGPIYRRPEAPRTSAPNQPLGPNQSRPSQPNPNAPLSHREERGKAPIWPSPNPSACFKCHQVSHFARNYPHRALFMEELEDSETKPIIPLEEKVYQVKNNLANEYEEEEDYESPDLLGVVRCILT